MDNKLKILLVEDSETDADLLIRFLRKQGLDFIFTRVWNREDYILAIKETNLDIIIADNSLPQFSGMEAFQILKNEDSNVPFIIVTGTVSENVLIEYAKEGIDDYFLKENLLRLPSAIEHVISKKKIEQLNVELGIAYQHISSSINYAKTIQDAMLPDPTVLINCFPESFILFKPRDIISGDFYWLNEEKKTFYVAAADCTGHGVPGALLSMIGIEKLNNIVLEHKEPADMLTQLNKRITFALGQSEHLANSNDGMDIAICSIDKQNRNLNFSGAYRPLWIIRKNQEEIEVIKGTRKAIGGMVSHLCNNFESHKIKLQHGDTIYLFSDGYSDLFGGEYNRKLTIKGFKQLLISIQNKTMNQQSNVLSNFIDEWKQNLKQTDDILVIGIRVDF
jgi:serine phosphatase RsbU (regulator of sigma subunit)